MFGYILKRLLLIIPTLLGILLINFAIVQFAPGGPVELMLAKLEAHDTSATAGFSGVSHETMHETGAYQGKEGVDPELVAEIKKMYGFDKPAPTRLWIMLKHYAQFDFGTSYFQDKKVIDLIIEKLPVSISLGLWTTLLAYLVCIPLGIRKAIKDGSQFDVYTSGVIIVGYAVPNFLFAVLCIVLFAGGSFFDVFPLQGLVSDDWQQLSWFGKLTDYLWHMALPVLAMAISGFATLTMLTKNSFLDEIHKQYVISAYAKGNTEKRVLYKHIFRNAMLIVIAGFPAAFIGILVTGNLLIEVVFSLDGLGLLGYEAVINRDYPVLFGTLFIFTLFGLVLNLIGDLMYVLIDPRINFESLEAR